MICFAAQPRSGCFAAAAAADPLRGFAAQALTLDWVDPNLTDIAVLHEPTGVRLVAVRAGDVVEAGTLGTPLRPTTPVPWGMRRTVAATLMAVPAGPATPERAVAAAAVQRLLTIEGLARHAFRLAAPRNPPAIWATAVATLRSRAAAAAEFAGHKLFDAEME